MEENDSLDKEYYVLLRMEIGDEIDIPCKIRDANLVVRRVPSGWLFTYIKSVIKSGEVTNKLMTTTFVPKN